VTFIIKHVELSRINNTQWYIAEIYYLSATDYKDLIRYFLMQENISAPHEKVSAFINGKQGHSKSEWR